MANRVLALVKKMFNFALDREWIDANPAARLKPVSPETRRDRVLSPEEIRTLWRELDSEHHRIAALFRTQLLTAQRPGEVSKMRWAQLDPALFERTTDGVVLPSKLEPVVWTIPAKDAKNGLAHEVPLSAAVIELLRNLAKRDEEERAKIQHAVSSQEAPAGERAERVRVPVAHAEGSDRRGSKGGATASQPLRLHVHRPRSAADRGDADGGRRGAGEFQPEGPESRGGRVTRRHDNLHAYRGEKRAALETWARYLEAILANKQLATGTVVPFRR